LLPELFQFAYVPKYEDAIKYLAENLAEKEEWDWSTSTEKTYSILKNYIEHTFRKIKSEEKVVYTTDNQYACFNTGLTTSNQEEIFAFFEKLRTRKEGASAEFCLKAFLKKSDNLLLQYFSSNLPDIADYFTNPELLIFNPKNTLIPDIDHIICDNISRFPDTMKNTDEAEVRRRLIGSIEEVKKRVKSNYKLAVPQYFNNSIQLLLPLNLTAGSPNPDLALVVYKLNDKTYSAKTCLTIQMAYNNARLIVKPQSDWLKP